MPRLESVPNVSEGRDPAVVASIARGFSSGGARVLDVHSDVDHHRSVLTLVADSDAALVDSLVRGIEAARDTIDLRSHSGIHPRVGAADVVPIVPLTSQDTERAVAAAHLTALRVADELELPVFMYGLVGEGRRPAFYRRGGTEELQRRIAAGELAPDHGPSQLDVRAGAVLLGVRAPLVAFNLVLDGGDLEIARAIAATIRASSGGMPGVQALGLELSDGSAQVSTNVVELEAVSLTGLVARVREEARARGAEVRESELVGLMPASVVLEAAVESGLSSPAGDDGLPTSEALDRAAEALALPSLRPDRVLEWHLAGGAGIPRPEPDDAVSS